MSVVEDNPQTSPWHEGERAVQRRAGVEAERTQAAGRVIRDFMTEQHRTFFAQLPFLLAGSVDAEGRPWASLLSGPPGFAMSPDPKHLRIAALPAQGDPLAAALRVGARVALLGIELPTRRRNRLNGPVVARDAEGFTVAVEQSFGNCPKYIQRRVAAAPAPGEAAPVRAEPFAALDDDARALVRAADTCFVASAAPADGDGHGAVDVSHRGGRPGFIDFADDGALVVPDYRGNRYFNTLGNLAANPRAGLLFIDFLGGDLLQLTGTTEIVWSGLELRAFVGAERLWRLKPTAGQWLRGGFPLRTQFIDFSPMSLATGTWAEATSW